MIFRAQDLFLSCTACGSLHFGNRASQIVHRMKTECTDSSPTQHLQALQRNSSPQQQLFCKKSALLFTCLIQQEILSSLSLFLALSKAEVLVLPLFSPLGFCLIKESTQGARGKERTHVTAFGVGKILRWAVPFSFPPSLSPSCQTPLVLQLKGGERRRGNWSSFTLHPGLLSPLFLFAWKYQSL